MNAQDEQQLATLYRDTFPDAARVVKQLGGDHETARDLFHDALVIYLEKSDAQKAAIKTSPKAYLIGITRILWFRSLRENNHYRQVGDSEAFPEIPEDFHPDEQERSLLRHLQAAGEKCMRLLRGFYYEQLSLQQLAQRFRYGSVRSATVQKHKCLEKVRTEVRKTMSHENSFA